METITTCYLSIPLVPSLSTDALTVIGREGEALVLTCDPSDQLVQVEWLYRYPSEDNIPVTMAYNVGFEFSPPDLNHRYI